MLAETVAAIGREDFYRVLFEGLREQLGACQLVLQRFDVGPTIRPLAIEADRELAAHDHTKAYITRLYPSDPFLPELTPASRREIAVRAVSTDRLQDSEYRDRLFLSDRLAGKLSLIVRQTDHALSLSIYRRARDGAFVLRDIRRLSTLSNVLSAAVERHCALSREGLSDVEGLADALAQLPVEKPLSERERLICAHVVLGRSNQDIASELDISFHTVSTHLRRAYVKLDVNSRSELFGLLLRFWAGGRALKSGPA